jgi:hypothetical protein
LSSFDGHITQGKKNLDFLVNVNQSFPDVYDWQVTVAFYAALHFANAHVFKTLGTYHKTHKDLANAINPESRIKNPAQFSEDAFVAYETLFILSRRARYLYHAKSKEGELAFTYDKHLAKSIRHLDTVMKWIDDKHNLGFNKRNFTCSRLKQGELHYFRII